MHKYKTPQEVFALMLEQWDKWTPYDHIWLDGICFKLHRMCNMEMITDEEHINAFSFMKSYRQEAIDKFNAFQTLNKPYWWRPNNLKIRKQFVKFLSEQP